MVRRLRYAEIEQRVTLPWGDEITVDGRESIGSGIARLGVHELSVSEAMWRLTDHSDIALDVGANIGYFTSLLSHRARAVISLEPHPVLLQRLRANVAHWKPCITVEGAAASSSKGLAELGQPAVFGVNAGMSGLDVAGECTFPVETVALDELVEGSSVGMLKIDVEGHELAALEGLGNALAERRVRDILFEERDPLPTPVSDRLTNHGFELFSLRQRLGGVRLRRGSEARSGLDAPTYLATARPERARSRLRGFGWRCL